ncbi:MAG: putative Ig domain-containing protein, partial [Burkholderiales bacterium]
STHTFSGTPLNGDVSVLNVRVTAKDSSNVAVSDDFLLTVANVNDAPVVNFSVGTQNTKIDNLFSYTLPAGGFTDVDSGDVLTYSATLANGGALPAWLSFNPTDKRLSGTPPADQLGQALTVRLIATDLSSATNSVSFSLNVVTDRDAISGTSGADTLDGGTGADTMTGLQGDDTYIVDNSGDVIVEAFGAGTDLVRASASYVLPGNVELIELTGSTAVNATGNGLANSIVGNADINRIDGGLGADYLAGGAGDDTYVVESTSDVVDEDVNAGFDTIETSITLSLPVNVEAMTLTGNGAIDAIGNTLPNLLIGNIANNRLDGNTGNDTLKGGLGDDTYVIDSIGDVVTEFDGEGSDTVESLVTYTLLANQENLILLGSAAINGTGNSLSNQLIGNNANNVLTGLAGDDLLKGQGGADTLIGGTGNDQYYADASDTVTELDGQGVDVLYAISSLTLPENIENVVFFDANVFFLVGNGLNNVFVGNDGDNQLDGAGGNDTIDGFLGNDTLDGGDGSDSLLGGGGDDVYVVDNLGDIVSEVAGAGNADKVRAAIEDYQLANEVENLDLQTGIGRGFGNNKANTLKGNAGKNVLDGKQGADRMEGGQGGDTYFVDDAGDTVVETDNTPSGSSGLKLDIDLSTVIDTVVASISFTLANYVENLTLSGAGSLSGTGNTLENALLGNNGANALSGLEGADTLTGGSGNDILDGGAGTDIATYSGNRLAYVITPVTFGYTVVDTNFTDGDDGTDVLNGIERLMFADAAVTLVGNNAPTAGTYAKQSAGTGQSIALNLSALFTDIDGDTLNFTATGLPNGLSMGSTNGQITGTAPASGGLHQIVVTATDGGGLFASLAFDLAIAGASSGNLAANVVTRSGATLPGVSTLELPGNTTAENLFSFSRGITDFSTGAAGKPITAADALDALKLSVGLSAFTGNGWKELIAADMTRDGRVTAADALEILKTSVGINTIQPSWVFVPTDAGVNPNLGAMQRDAVTYKNDLTLAALNGASSASITGILVGDVNNSWLIPT